MGIDAFSYTHMDVYGFSERRTMKTTKVPGLNKETLMAR